ncbi:MAG TPA: hypothetical protein PLN91_00940 [Rhodanobacteraceae bacterium]|nr:hypothetical protein [Rhodanobacteraceae bacterium]
MNPRSILAGALTVLATIAVPQAQAITPSAGLVLTGTADSRPVLCRPATSVTLALRGGVLTLDADCGGVARLHCQPTTLTQQGTALQSDCKTITPSSAFKVAHLPAMTTVMPGSTAPLLVQVYNNTGKVLSTLSVSASKAPSCSATRTSVGVGAVVSYTCSSPAASTDLVDTLTVQGNASDGTVYRGSASAIVMADGPRLGIAVQPRYQKVPAGAPAQWDVWVRNMGPTDLTSLLLADQRLDTTCSGSLNVLPAASLVYEHCGLPGVTQSFLDRFSASALAPSTLLVDTTVQVVTGTDGLFHGDFDFP